MVKFVQMQFSLAQDTGNLSQTCSKMTLALNSVSEHAEPTKK